VASHKSALKAHKQSLQNREANRQNRSRLRSTLKTIRQALTAGDAAGVKSQLDQTVSLIDKMAAKGVIHDNAAARYKSRLARRLNGLTAA
jgi:small subunit ribosomal protein S20